MLHFIVADAWGKIPTGILSGNLFELGNFDQCLDIAYQHQQSNIESDFYGKYYLSNVIIDVPSGGAPSHAKFININLDESMAFERNPLISFRQDNNVLQKLVFCFHSDF